MNQYYYWLSLDQHLEIFLFFSHEVKFNDCVSGEQIWFEFQSFVTQIMYLRTCMVKLYWITEDFTIFNNNSHHAWQKQQDIDQIQREKLFEMNNK